MLRTLLARLVLLGMRIKLVLLDRGLYSVRVLQDLIACKMLFIMPAVKRGKKPPTPGGPPGTYALAAKQHSHWSPHTLKNSKEGRGWTLTWPWSVTTPGATGGVKARPLRWLRATYRRRFGIESSYRQAHQACIRTSSHQTEPS